MIRHKRKYTRWSRRIERNILSVYVRANEHDRAEGLYWYANAHDSCRVMAGKLGVSMAQAAGVVAALSPGLNWGLNLLQAELFIGEWVKGARGKDLPMVGVYGYRNVRKSIRILQGDNPREVLGGGMKTQAFYDNILAPLESKGVAIDRHAKGLALRSNSARGATATQDAIVTPSEYPYYVRHYVGIAERLGLIPHQLQAVCWVTWRRLKGNLEQNDLPF